MGATGANIAGYASSAGFSSSGSGSSMPHKVSSSSAMSSGGSLGGMSGAMRGGGLMASYTSFLCRKRVGVMAGVALIVLYIVFVMRVRCRVGGCCVGGSCVV